MPIFEYVCAECGHKFEKLILSASKARQIHCPECESQSVNKALSVFGLGASTVGVGSSANCAPSG